ncbi:unnamed protein product [Fraxinus pennsylvanica]|uniref:Uncharacterized protein n=1 Tax=Fraxinus pennsylvanica TaxID=56036 RepID=A0AAD2EDZ6_9LAMI|nr:unnamed protein product [Fraxinus pennsylvanica]
MWTAISNIDLRDLDDRTKSDYLECWASLLDSVGRILLQHDDSDIERLRFSFKMPIPIIYSSKIVVLASNLVYLNCISDFSINLLVATRSLANAYVDVYNYEEVEEEVSRRNIRSLTGNQSVGSLTISDDTLEDVPVFQNLIHLKVVREMSSHRIGILLVLMQRISNLRFLEIAEEFTRDTEIILQDDRNFEIITCCLRSHLKACSIKAIYGQEAPILLLKHFLKHSAVIQRVVVHYPNNASDYMGK